MWMIIGGFLLFSWGYHLGKEDGKKYKKKQNKNYKSYNVKQLEYYQPPPSAPKLEYTPYNVEDYSN